MTYNPAIHHRRSIRLKGYDYTQAGLYFITICTQDRERLFGKIVNRKMILSDAGLMVETVWNEIPQYYIDFDIHAFIVMPDHIHGIIEKKSIQYPDVRAIPRDCPNSKLNDCPKSDNSQINNDCPNDLDNNDNPQIIFNKNYYPNNIDRAGTGTCPVRATPRGCPKSIPDIVQRFKSLTTKRYTDGVKQKNWKPYNGKLWQRNYYEHIIRNDESYIRISEYIKNNPQKWKGDEIENHHSQIEGVNQNER